MRVLKTSTFRLNYLLEGKKLIYYLQRRTTSVSSAIDARQHQTNRLPEYWEWPLSPSGRCPMEGRKRDVYLEILLKS